MNAKTIENWDYALGTSLQGYISTTKGELIKIFGAPTYEALEGEKTTIEWVLQFEDGTVATIYDYKREGSGWYGEDEYLLGDDEQFDFHIGGADKRAVELVTARVKEGN